MARNVNTSPARTPIRGEGWKKRSTVDSTRFEQVAAAILTTLSSEPIRFTDLARRVAMRLPRFEGSVPWYTITCLRELEVRGQVTRHRRPVLYSLRSPAPKATPRAKARR